MKASVKMVVQPIDNADYAKYAKENWCGNS